MPVSFTDVVPKRCPSCGGNDFGYRPRVVVYCLSCGAIVAVEMVTVPAAPAAPADADRLRTIVRRYVALYDAALPELQMDPLLADLAADARKALEETT